MGIATLQRECTLHQIQIIKIANEEEEKEREENFERFHELRFGSLAAPPPMPPPLHRRLPRPRGARLRRPWHCAAAAVGQNLGGRLRRRARGRLARCLHEFELGYVNETGRFTRLFVQLFPNLIHSQTLTSNSLAHCAGRVAAPEPAGAQISLPLHPCHRLNFSSAVAVWASEWRG